MYPHLQSKKRVKEWLIIFLFHNYYKQPKILHPLQVQVSINLKKFFINYLYCTLLLYYWIYTLMLLQILFFPVFLLFCLQECLIRHLLILLKQWYPRVCHHARAWRRAHPRHRRRFHSPVRQSIHQRRFIAGKDFPASWPALSEENSKVWIYNLGFKFPSSAFILHPSSSRCSLQWT